MGEHSSYQDLLDAADVVEFLPKLGGKYRKTSDATINYNCLAWAVGVDWAFFDPTENCVGYYWPDGIEREWTVAAIRKLFALFGYREESNSPTKEDGYDKIAFFIDSSGIPTHFARQLGDGKWTSKLGDLIDVEHETLDCMEGDEPHYGTVQFFLRRKVDSK